MRFCAVFVLLSFTLPAAAAAGFDCTRAAAPDKLAICAHPALSALDMLVLRAYDEARRGSGGPPDPKGRADTLADARTFNACKRLCGQDIGCLTAAHVGALEDFIADGSSVAVPDWVAATAMTTVAPPETAHLPTREGECVRTRIAGFGGRLDGDDRGRSCTSTNLRTNRTWSLGNSQHMYGGA